MWLYGLLGAGWLWASHVTSLCLSSSLERKGFDPAISFNSAPIEATVLNVSHACQIPLLIAPYVSSMTLLTMYNLALVFVFINCLPSQTKQGPHLTQPQHVAWGLAHVYESVHERNAGNVLDTHYSLGHSVVFTRPSMWRVWTCREQCLNLREGKTEKDFLEFCFICSGSQKIPRQIYMCLPCGGGLKTGRREKRNLVY